MSQFDDIEADVSGTMAAGDQSFEVRPEFISAQKTRPNEHQDDLSLAQAKQYPPYALLVAAFSVSATSDETVSIKSKKQGYGALKEEAEDKIQQSFYCGPDCVGFDTKHLLPSEAADMPLTVLRDMLYLQNRDLELLAYSQMTYNTQRAQKYLKIYQDLVEKRNKNFERIERKYFAPTVQMSQKDFNKYVKRFAKAYDKAHSKVSRSEKKELKVIFEKHNDAFREYLGSVQRNEHAMSSLENGKVVFVNEKNWQEGSWKAYYVGKLEDPYKTYYMTREAVSILDVNIDVVKNACQACHKILLTEYRNDNNVMKKIGEAIKEGEGSLGYLRDAAGMTNYLDDNIKGKFSRLKPSSNIFKRSLARLKRFNDTTSLYALSASRVQKYKQFFEESEKKHVLISFSEWVRFVVAAITSPAGVVSLKVLDFLTGKSVFCFRKTAKTLRSIKKGYRIKRSVFKLAGMGVGSLTSAIIGGGCGLGIAWGIGAIGIATYGTALPAYAAWLIGAIVGSVLGLSVGAYGGWMTSKYVAKLISKLVHNDTNPNKYRLTKKEKKNLLEKDLDLDAVESALKAIYVEKNSSSLLRRITPNGMAKKRRLNRLIYDLKKGIVLDLGPIDIKDLTNRYSDLKRDRNPLTAINTLGEPKKNRDPDEKLPGTNSDIVLGGMDSKVIAEFLTGPGGELPRNPEDHTPTDKSEVEDDDNDDLIELGDGDGQPTGLSAAFDDVPDNGAGKEAEQHLADLRARSGFGAEEPEEGEHQAKKHDNADIDKMSLLLNEMAGPIDADDVDAADSKQQANSETVVAAAGAEDQQQAKGDTVAADMVALIKDMESEGDLNGQNLSPLKEGWSSLPIPAEDEGEGEGEGEEDRLLTDKDGADDAAGVLPLSGNSATMFAVVAEPQTQPDSTRSRSVRLTSSRSE